MKDIEKYNKIILLIELFIIFTVITLGIKYYFKPFIIIIIMLIIGRTFYDFFLKINILHKSSLTSYQHLFVLVAVGCSIRRFSWRRHPLAHI